MQSLTPERLNDCPADVCDARAPEVSIRELTPPDRPAIHRFYDTSPISPSGRYVAVTRMPTDTRPPEPGEVAYVDLVDLEDGSIVPVAQTRAWDMQLGAQVQWGATDRDLLFNDMVFEQGVPVPAGVRLDPFSGQTQRLAGTVYMAHPAGTHVASPCLRRIGLTQPGYGVAIHPSHLPHLDPVADDDGVFVTDLATGECRLVCSIRRIVDECRLDPAGGTFHGFHVKYNPQGDRLMFVLRWLDARGTKQWRSWCITLRVDGSEPRVALDADRWAVGGHHPNFTPDGRRILMNLRPGPDQPLRFVTFNLDGSDFRVLSERIIASGHPTLHPDGRHLLTDAYLKDAAAFGDGTTPLRWIDLHTEQEATLARVRTQPHDAPVDRDHGVLRVDPHPAWDRDFKRFVFNACPTGVRQVFLATLS